jgi:hypothetical protein
LAHRKTHRFTGRALAARQTTTDATTPSPFHVEGLEVRQLLSAATHHHLRHHWHTGFHVTPSATPNYVITSHHKTASAQPDSSSSPYGFSPAAVRHAYGIDSTTFEGITGDGSGQTIAIVDAYNDPTIASDLATFDKQFGLTDPSLTVVGQTGTSALPGLDPAGKGNSWAVETSLDVEWAHAVAPKANLLLVEANSSAFTDLFSAVDTARNWAGVSVVSMSFGGAEFSGETTYNSHFTTPTGHQGVTFIASSGDNGAYTSSTMKGVEYPAASVNVLAVGGTKLTVDSSNNYSSESAWGSGTTSYSNGGAGGGISKYASQPTYQNGTVTQTTSKRAVPDVAFLADPASGVAVVDSYDFGTAAPWLAVGGTSLAAPMWAGVIAMIDQGRVINGRTTLDGPTGTLPAVYQLSASNFHDITTGNNGYAAGMGYDLVTGRGTPIVNLLAPALSGGPAVAPLPSYVSASPGAVYSYNPSAAALSLTSGTLTFTADEGSNPSAYGAPLSVTVTGSGSNLVFQTDEHLAGLTLSDGGASLASSSATTLTLSGPLSITGAGTLDLGVGNLLAPTSSNLAAYIKQAAGPALAGSGLNAWQGSGLTSRVVQADGAAGNPRHLAIGYFDSQEDAQTGLSVPAGDTLVHYTVYGDATGNGVNDTADFTVWRNNFFAGSRWSQGDFNYDGVIDTADFTIWRNNFFASV